MQKKHLIKRAFIQACVLLVSCVTGFIGKSAASEVTDGFVAHEWGTFTQVSGSNGTPIKWWTSALEGVAELPAFVGRNPFTAKASLAPVTLRMETPVIYFYPPKPMKVQVSVNWSSGRLTEWFPSPNSFPAGETVSWELSLFHPDDDRKRNIPAVGDNGAHYAHARNVPKAWLVQGKNVQHMQRAKQKPEWEKLLFYRGAGEGSLPLWIRVNQAGDSLTVLNPLMEATSKLFLLQRTDGKLEWRLLGALPGSFGKDAPDVIQKIPLTGDNHPDHSSEEKLVEALIAELVEKGLFPDEAKAMVDTWKDSWLQEEGLRLLSVLPRSWVDSTLPLNIQPAPQKVERVFVARYEVLLPRIEQEVLTLLKDNHKENLKTSASALKNLKLGRFENAAMERAVTMEADRMRSQFSSIQTEVKSAETASR